MLSNSLTKRRARLTSERGFTLIELLVVIAIIAILAAILFPVFAKVREKARQTACLSNMNQIAKGLEMYKQDFEGYFPPSTLPAGCVAASVPQYSWPTLMYSYISSQEVFACPDTTPGGKENVNFFDNTAPLTPKTYYGQTKDTGTTAGDGSTLGVGLVHGLSYARNLIPDAQFDAFGNQQWVDSTWGQSGSVAVTSPGCATPVPASPSTNLHKSGFVGISTTASCAESQVEAPATTIHIVDAVASGPTNGNSIRGIQQEYRTDHYLHKDASGAVPNTANKPSSRHSDGFNAIYGDGHVKWNHFGATKAADWTIQDD